MSLPPIVVEELGRTATLTGNWFGARDALSSWGIAPASLRDRSHGERGRRAAARQAYAGQLAAELTADMEKRRPPGAHVRRVDGRGSGTDLSADLGNAFTVAEYFEGRNIVRLYNLYLQQRCSMAVSTSGWAILSWR